MNKQITISHWSDGRITVRPVTENHFEGQDPVEYITQGFKTGRNRFGDEFPRIIKAEWTNAETVN